MKNLLIKIIKLYKNTPSKWHNYCKFYPHCSDYAIGVINNFGVLKGSFYTIKRILRCNIFSKGGYDPIPRKR